MNRFRDKLFVTYKHSGPSSFDVVEAFRSATRVRKVGHTGTLDPLAEGVLLLCSGRATRAVEHFMNLEKTYRFDVHLGVETTTLDSEGEVVRREPCPHISVEKLREVASGFVGEYELEPPVFSAIKSNGKRLYELARAGEKAVSKTKTVTIYELEVTETALPVVSYRLTCSRGTYVRSLARDIGRRLGLPAHVAHLVRERIGPFGVADAYPTERIFARDVGGLEGMDLSVALGFLPAIVVSDSAKRRFYYGGLPAEGDIVEKIGAADPGGAVRIMDEGGNLLAVGSRSASAAKRRLSWVDSYRLFVDRQSLISS